MGFIKSVDLGELKDFKTDFFKDEDGDNDSNEGVYRDLEQYLITLSKLYFHLEEVGVLKLEWFGSVSCFKVAVGADGALFGKDDEATCWLLSFINLTDRIASCYENFLLCGANSAEGSMPMIRYAEHLRDDISRIEQKEYEIQGKKVSFKFEFVPSDMKWLATFSGELSNAAYYFSPFGNVNNDNKNTINGSLGKELDCTWQPWNYAGRIAEAQKVEKYKKTITRYAPSTQRQKILAYMKSEGTRQEFEPILGPLIDKAYAEPLHNTNNALQHFHAQLLREAERKSDFPSNIKLGELSKDCIIRKFTYTLRSIEATRLLKKVRKWVNSGRNGSFDYRFTGKESKLLSNHLMKLILSLRADDDDHLSNFKLHVFAYVGMQLREAESFYSQVHPPDQNYLACLKKSCQLYFNSVSLFQGSSVSPTVWTIGYVVRYHAQLIFRRYSLGLWVNIMQGRKAKHTMIGAFARHSTLSLRWQLVFRHEYISCVWLRNMFPKSPTFSSHKVVKYVPDFVYKDNYCYCGLEKPTDKEICDFCSDPLTKYINESSVQGELVEELKTLMSTSYSCKKNYCPFCICQVSSL